MTMYSFIVAGTDLIRNLDSLCLDHQIFRTTNVLDDQKNNDSRHFDPLNKPFLI
jgi:hypothetical protein